MAAFKLYQLSYRRAVFMIIYAIEEKMKDEKVFEKFFKCFYHQI